MRRMGRRSPRRSERMTSINITPMVDVMLVLLIIFMITAPMMKSGVHLDLPQTQSKSLQISKKPVSIEVTKNGNIYIGKTKLTQKNFLPALDKEMKKDFSKQLYIRGDKSVSYGTIAEIMVLVAKHGYSKIALVTDNKKK